SPLSVMILLCRISFTILFSSVDNPSVKPFRFNRCKSFLDVRTNVPLPRITSMTPSSPNSLIALRIVMRLTSKIPHSSDSFGILSPGFKLLVLINSLIPAFICSYNKIGLSKSTLFWFISRLPLYSKLKSSRHLTVHEEQFENNFLEFLRIPKTTVKSARNFCRLCGLFDSIFHSFSIYIIHQKPSD